MSAPARSHQSSPDAISAPPSGYGSSTQCFFCSRTAAVRSCPSRTVLSITRESPSVVPRTCREGVIRRRRQPGRTAPGRPLLRGAPRIRQWAGTAGAGGRCSPPPAGCRAPDARHGLPRRWKRSPVPDRGPLSGPGAIEAFEHAPRFRRGEAGPVIGHLDDTDGSPRGEGRVAARTALPVRALAVRADAEGTDTHVHGAEGPPRRAGGGSPPQALSLMMERESPGSPVTSAELSRMVLPLRHRPGSLLERGLRDRLAEGERPGLERDDKAQSLRAEEGGSHEGRRADRWR